MAPVPAIDIDNDGAAQQRGDGTGGESDPDRHSIVLGIADPMLARHLHRYVQRHPRFRLVGTAANTIQTLYAVRETTPMIVVMSDMAEGMRGRSALAEIAERSPQTCVILLTAAGLSEIPSAANLAWVVPEHAVHDLHDALEQIAAFFDGPRPQALDRRHALDHRVGQDWSKVFAERRDEQRRRSHEPRS